MNSLFPSSWFAAGLVDAASAADFARYAASSPQFGASHWRWLAFRDCVEEHGHLSAEDCRNYFRLGEEASDAALGTAIMCSVLYQRHCPADLRAAALNANAAVRRAALIAKANPVPSRE